MSDDMQQTQLLHPEPSNLSAGDMLAGRFRLQQILGKGCQGVVYAAMDMQLHVEVAVKVLSPELCRDQQQLERLRNELLLSRRISHPNVLRVHEFHQDSHGSFYSMDKIDGQSLSALLPADDWPLAQKSAFILALLDALTAAHQRGIFHCDIKPANILLDRQGQPYVMDFGIAVTTAQVNGYGSPAYCAPEYQIDGAASAAADLYALGATLFETFYGQMPFVGNNPEQLLSSKRAGGNIGESFACSQHSVDGHQAVARFITALTAVQPGQRPVNAAAAKALWLDCCGALTEDHKTSFTRRGKFIAAGLVGAGLLFSVLFGLMPEGQHKMSGEADNVPREAQHSSAEMTELSVAVLPFFDRRATKVAQALSSEYRDEPLVALGQAVLIDKLQQARLTVPDTRRIDQTIRYLGFRLPLSEAQLSQLAELLGVSHLVVADFQAGAEQYHLQLNLIDTRTRPMSSTPLHSDLLERSELAPVLTEVAAQLHRALSPTSPPAVTQGDEATGDHRYVEALAAFQRGDLATARQWLQQMQAEGTQPLSATMLAAKIAFAEQRWLDLEPLLVTVIEAAPNDSRLFHQAQILNALSRQDQTAARQLYQTFLAARPYDNTMRFEYAGWLAAQQDFAAAKEQLQTLLQRDKYNGSAWFELSKVAIVSGDIQRALDDYLVQALVISKRIKDKAAEGEVLNAFGVALQRQGNIEQAVDYYHQALTIRRALEDKRGIATSLTNLATVASIQGGFEQAQVQLQQALRIWQQLKNNAGTANTLDKLGVLEEERGRYYSALDYYRQSLQLRMAMDDPWAQAESMNNVGFSYFVLSQFDHAKTYLKQAEQAYRQLSEPMGIIKVRQSLAQIYLRQGQWDAAYQAFQTSIEAAESRALNDELVVAKAYLGRLSFEQGRFAQARDAWQEALSQVEAVQDQRGMIEFTTWLIDLYLTLGQVEVAQQLLLKLAPLLSGSTNAEQALNAKLLQAELKLQQGQDEAVKTLLAAIETEITADTPPLITLKFHRFKQYLALWWPQLGFTFNAELDESLLSLYRTEGLQYVHWLELLAHYYSAQGQWDKVEQTLNQAIPYLRSMKHYWRRYQFAALTYRLNQHRDRRAVASYQNDFAGLVEGLPVDWRDNFITLQSVKPVGANHGGQ